jgi:hypothetical protein
MFTIGETHGIDNDLLSISKHFRNKFHVDVILQHGVDERFILISEIKMPPDWKISKRNRVENYISEVVKLFASQRGWDICIPDDKNPGFVITIYKYKVTARDRFTGFSN